MRLPALFPTFLMPTAVFSFSLLSLRSPLNTHISKLHASSEWSAADDWSKLSADSQPVDSAAIFNTDIVDRAASDLAKSASSVLTLVNEDPDDIIIADAIETIQNSIDPSDPPLYDTPTSFARYAASEDAAEIAAKEIGLLIRCNESPQDLLVSEGRALPPLTEEERYDTRQMVRAVEVEGDGGNNEETTYETTKFFDLAVKQMFDDHATATSDDETVLDASGVASWLTKCLGDETNTAVGRHSKEVSTIIAKHGTYGSGVVNEAEFHQLYTDAIVNSIKTSEKKTPLQKMDPKMIYPTIDSIWRDLRNHDLVPPSVIKHKILQAELDAKYGSADVGISTMATPTTADTIFDECEIMEWGETDHSNPGSYFDIADGDLTTTQKSSHERVELISDNKTPKRIRDGKFVFIDEESCIGCTQCANVASSTFVMLDNGRARTFEQGTSPEIKAAVSSCPVSCMHYVGYKELKKYETARDHGDGTDRRSTHIPLNVAGMDSDANRKSSWYHSLRHKCNTSQCPQKGCYDCPSYASPGQNPYFQAKHREAESARARDLINSGEADLWRKTVEL